MKYVPFQRITATLAGRRPAVSEEAGGGEGRAGTATAGEGPLGEPQRKSAPRFWGLG